MKFFAALSLIMLAGATAVPATADNPPLGGVKAACPSGDLAVIVNTERMSYMIDSMSNRTSMKGMMAHDKFICRSAAIKMGAKPKTMSPKTMSPMPMSGSKM
jgi:hypothetical protein